MFKNFKKALLCSFFGFIFIANQIYALETDQFISWKTNLNDSLPAINQYLNDRAKHILDSINNINKNISCNDVHEKIITQGFSGPRIITYIEDWAYFNPLLDRLPSPQYSKDHKEIVVNQTIYKNVDSLKVRIFGITLNLNGIYVGIDKLAHLLQTGYAYFKIYNKEFKKTNNHISALTEAINQGIFQEKTYYGLRMTGIFSYADLEANYQGLLLNLNFCSGENPYLVKSADGHWMLSSTLDLAKFINPYYDESYNLSAYTKRRFRIIKNDLLEYCELRNSALVKERFENYKRSMPTPSLSMQYLRAQIDQGELPNPIGTGLDFICNP